MVALSLADTHTHSMVAVLCSPTRVFFFFLSYCHSHTVISVTGMSSLKIATCFPQQGGMR